VATFRAIQRFWTFLPALAKLLWRRFFTRKYPFSEVVRHLPPQTDRESHSLGSRFNSVLQNYPMPEIRWPGLTVRALKWIPLPETIDLSVLIEKKRRTPRSDSQYNTDLFDSSTMQRMLDEYASLLRRVLKHPDVTGFVIYLSAPWSVEFSVKSNPN